MAEKIETTKTTEYCYLTTLLLHAQQALSRETEEALKTYGLSLAKYNILNALAEAGGRLPFSELVEQLGCVRSNVTGLIDRLQEDQLVRRVDHPEDRRMLFAELTPEGQRLVSQAEPCHAEAIAKILGKLTLKERDELSALLERIV